MTCFLSLALDGLEIFVVARYLLKLIFEEYGFETIAAHWVEALEILQQFKPDLLISEISLNYQNGYSLICKVKAFETPGIAQIPARVTTSPKQSVIAHALSVGKGASTYLPKLFDIDKLLAMVACPTKQVQGVLTT